MTTNKFETRADGMHYREAFGRTVEIVNLDEGVFGTVTFPDGMVTECKAFKDVRDRTFMWVIELKEAYTGEVKLDAAYTFYVDAVLDGETWDQLRVSISTDRLMINSRERFPLK